MQIEQSLYITSEKKYSCVARAEGLLSGCTGPFL
nr:MAG TPA: hypothetical protein [Caudoviricetes sp.]